MFGSTYNGQDFTSCKLDGRITTVLTFPLGVCSSLLWIWHLLPSLLTLFQIFPPQSRGSSSGKRRKTNAVSIFRGKCWHFHGVKNPRSGMVFSVVNVLGTSVQLPSLNFHSEVEPYKHYSVPKTYLLIEKWIFTAT